jgi:hypothetical protein
MEEALMETVMELLKIFTLVIGIGLIAGAMVVVSWDVYRESERHRLLARLPRYSARHYSGPHFSGQLYSGQRGVAAPRARMGSTLSCR